MASDCIAQDDGAGLAALLASGLSPDARDERSGAPLLFTAVAYAAEACAEALLAAGANSNWQDALDTSPLMVAATDDCAPIARLLLAHGADAALTNSDQIVGDGSMPLFVSGGRNALHFAALAGSAEVAALLLAHERGPALAEAADLDGLRPWELALRQGSRSAAREALAVRLRLPLGGGDDDDGLPSAEAVAELQRVETVAARARIRAAVDAREQASRALLDGYEPRHADLYLPGGNAGLAALLLPGAADPARATELAPGVFAVPLMAPEAAVRILEELEHFEAWARQTGFDLKRPNSMNNYGLVCNDIGLRPLMQALMRAVVQPLAAGLLGVETRLESQHAFSIRYELGGDLDLATHVDSSDVTLNVCLGRDFTGGALYFHSMLGEDPDDPFVKPHPTQDCPHCTLRYDHQPGVAVLHRGKFVHGATNVESGMRSNLIVWCRFGGAGCCAGCSGASESDSD